MTHAIAAENLGKKYRIQHTHKSRENYVALRDVIAEKARGLARPARKKNTAVDFWALRDVSFSVAPGEAIGIIGRNGAGKSTLLKILSRITRPTRGRVELTGRVASLLEVGTGFHPELTGRENIFLNGAILGMTRREIRAKFDEIVAFSEVEKFLDTPVKRYSSGMYVRLAFAVAAHLEPEILVIDEVLAVGDAGFQRKCLGKMDEVAKGHGRTVLFVSHQLDMVRHLCARCILLEDGRVRRAGPAEEVIADYQATVATGQSHATFAAPPQPDLPAQLLCGRFLNGKGDTAGAIDVFEDAAVEIDYELRRPAEGTVIALQVRRAEGVLFTSFDTDRDASLLLARQPGRYRARVLLPAPLFKPGYYTISANIGIANTAIVHELRDALQFQVDLLSRPAAFQSASGNRPGAIATALHWQTEKIG